MIRKLKSGQFRLYSRKKDPRTGKRRNLRTVRDPGGGRETRARSPVSSSGAAAADCVLTDFLNDHRTAAHSAAELADLVGVFASRPL
jgi:hypothetical protein